MVGRAANSVNIVLGTVSLSASFVNRQSAEIVIHPQHNPTTRDFK